MPLLLVPGWWRLRGRAGPTAPPHSALPSIRTILRMRRCLDTTAGRRGGQQLIFYGAWFCPFAHRAWLALLHRKVPFERVESLSHPDGPDQPYAKHPDLLRANPRGLVPTLVDGAGRVCTESLVTLELISELPTEEEEEEEEEIPATTAAPALLPHDPWERARARNMAAWVDTALCSPYYACLIPNEHNSPGQWQQKRAAGLETLLVNLRRFSAELEQRDGPFYFGSELSTVDLALAPWWV
eukprot:COSAG01_NODE_2043_length_8564_cov_76.365859_9_plen_241_part_00